jgi:dolichol-phosphate mannosyltransferase
LNTAEISIILPTYNESKNICEILDQIKKSFPSNLKLETIVVDDNSPDNTEKFA